MYIFPYMHMYMCIISLSTYATYAYAHHFLCKKNDQKGLFLMLKIKIQLKTGYGSYGFMKQASGLICCFSLRILIILKFNIQLKTGYEF